MANLSDTQTLTLDAFIEAAGLRMTVRRTDRNPHMDDDPRVAPMDHWRCVITCGRARMVVTFSMGSGHHGRQPELREVLDSLASDASGMDQPFEEWCRDYGYDTDSRRAERTYKACKHTAKRLRHVLGDTAFNTLLCDVERL